MLGEDVLPAPHEEFVTGRPAGASSSLSIHPFVPAAGTGTRRRGTDVRVRWARAWGR